MIRVETPADRLGAEVRFGLAVLLDQSRLLIAESPSLPAVAVRISDVPRVADTAASVSDLEKGLGVEDGTVTLDAGMLRAIVRLIAAGAERESPVHDRLGRVPSAQNALVQTGESDSPIIGHLAARLRALVMEVAPAPARLLLSPWPDGLRWACAITHDLDVVGWWPVFLGLRMTELLKRREWRRAFASAGAGLRQVAGRPVYDGVVRILAEEAKRRIRSTWFVLAGRSTVRAFLQGDVTYDLAGPAAQRILAAVQKDGHEIGLHGSFTTFADGDTMRRERTRLETLTRRGVAGVRQHFLRLDPGKTDALIEAAGFRYDATYGFADRSGFRLGVADVVPGWDSEGARPRDLDEVPLVWMDRAASKYRGIEAPEAWVAEAVATVGAVRQVEGLWVGLWHPNLTAPLGYPGAEAAFADLLDELGRAAPWFAPLAEIVSWRRARRSVRALGYDGENKLRLSGAAAVALESPDGRVVHEAVPAGARE